MTVKARGAMGVAAVIGASVALAVLMPYMAAPRATAHTTSPAIAAEMRSSAAPVVAPAAVQNPSTGAGLQYVGDVKQLDVPCEQQTWPYIAKQCLKAAPSQTPANTVARVAVDRAELKTSRAGLPAPAPTVQPEPVAQTIAVAPKPVPVAEVSPPPMPAARPAPRQSARDQARDAYARAPDESRRARPAREARDIRPDAYRTADRNPSPVVRRWTEAEYDVAGPFGSTRRVVVIRPQSVHQAAAFTDER